MTPTAVAVAVPMGTEVGDGAASLVTASVPLDRATARERYAHALSQLAMDAPEGPPDEVASLVAPPLMVGAIRIPHRLDTSPLTDAGFVGAVVYYGSGPATSWRTRSQGQSFTLPVLP